MCFFFFLNSNFLRAVLDNIKNVGLKLGARILTKQI